jgi:predicted transporter
MTMSTHTATSPNDYPVIPNGSGAAAILSAGIGALAVAFFSIAADRSADLKTLFSIYKPTGALSGVTTGAILVWLAVWTTLGWLWRKRTVSLLRINVIALVLLGLGLLFTFPPVADVF